MSLHRERGPMTLDDLRALPTQPLIVAEGTQITPRIVPPNGSAVWLLPSLQTQRQRWDRSTGRRAGPVGHYPSARRFAMTYRLPGPEYLSSMTWTKTKRSSRTCWSSGRPPR